MTKKSLIFIFVIVGICLLPLSSLKAQVIGIQWNTFMGSGTTDTGWGITKDNSDNIYVSGYSENSWGTPLNSHSGQYDVFVAKLDSNGNLLWNTFLGSASDDTGYSIVLDSIGNIYITGDSGASWGSPINAHSGAYDAFIAKLDNNGNMLWNTFLGGGSNDRGYEITIETTGNVYVIGYSDTSWGSPISAHAGSSDILVAKLDTNGNLLWHTFLGSGGYDYGQAIISSSIVNIYVTGYSPSSWGSPINPHSGNSDAFVAKMDTAGNLLWNTFLGSSNYDRGNGIKTDGSDNIYVTGYSYATWGSPVNAHSGNDAFVAKLDTDGSLIWNTFMGSSDEDVGWNLTVDSIGNSHVTGYTHATWGSPINDHSGSSDAFIAKLDSNGNRIWNTFLGTSNGDRGYNIISDSSGNLYVTGYSDATWGNPINPYSGERDTYVLKITPQPIPDILANGSDGPISITQSDTLQIKVSLVTYAITDDADWWLAQKTASGWSHFNKKTKSWDPGLDVTHQGALFDLGSKKVFQSSGLSPGVYRFYFGVDMNMNGILTKSCLYADMVKVTVTN